jgi:dUTP pyrophosphatase
MEITAKQYTPRIEKLLLACNNEQFDIADVIKKEFGSAATSTINWSPSGSYLYQSIGFNKSMQVPLFDYIVTAGKSVGVMTQAELYREMQANKVTIIPDIKIKVMLSRGAKMLEKKDGDSGYDLHCMLDTPRIEVGIGETVLINTGISVELPHGYELQVRPRSSTAINCLLVQLGTIDSSYRGEIRIPISNISNRKRIIEQNERIAQAVLSRVPDAELEQAFELSKTWRGGNGFGSTGK